MSNTKTAPTWLRLKDFDIGDLNELNSDIFESRYDPQNQSLARGLNDLFEKKYGYDDFGSGQGPYAAVVLSVLNGPQVKNQATTEGRVNTTSLDMDDYRNPYFEERDIANKKPVVIVKAKIPEFDVDIDWPKDNNDKVRIDAHGEFFQYREDPTLEKIDVGSIIWVDFNTNNKVSINGRPVGKIIGIHTIGVQADIRKQTSPKDSHKPKCQAARVESGPPGNLYVGNTAADPNQIIGPPIRKIKGNIKTGIYGNGTPQTKAHFDSALLESPASLKHQIPGPAPGSKNAFIWVGCLKNNGYMDLLDRPISLGRETIIYAPMTLDLSSPVEIKYYFHDVAGFGHAHLNGPGTTIESAVEMAKGLTGNDFREKIAPAIKDLNREGRNYILVIPEMSYSRGYGTTNSSLDRIKKISQGKADIAQGAIEGATIRTKVSQEARGPIKNYLNDLPIEATKNLLHVTPLRERQFATFDGSFSGGKFGDFHQEVVEVLEEHLGTMQEKVEYISILADGMGSLALSGIVADVPNSYTHYQGKLSFANTLMSKKLRIDYVTDPTLDASVTYSPYFGTTKVLVGIETRQIPTTPSMAFWRDFLIPRAAGPAGIYTEFNYITETSSKKQNALFSLLNKSSEFEKNSKQTSGIGKKKFSFTAQDGRGVYDPVFENHDVFLNMHLCPKDTPAKKSKIGYAFTAINDNQSQNYIDYPKKSDANTSAKPALSSVPDHAYALATSPNTAELEKIERKKQQLEAIINNFESIINKSQTAGTKWVETGNLDPITAAELYTKQDVICDEYPIYCKEGTFVLNSDSNFFKDYLGYLEKKKNYMELFTLLEYETRILDIISDRNELIKEKNNIQKLQANNNIEIESDIPNQNISYEKVWELLRTIEYSSKQVFIKELNFPWYVIGSPSEGVIAQVVNVISKKDAYEKIKNKLESAIKNASKKSIEKPKDCRPQPVPLATAISLPGSLPKAGNSTAPGNNCVDIQVSVPNNFQQLFDMISYQPVKSEFQFDGRESSTKTTVHLADGFEVDSFKYAARGIGKISGGPGITNETSPPVWACISRIIGDGWRAACRDSKYHPFKIVTGIRGHQGPLDGLPNGTKGTTAYLTGVSLHSFGLAIDVDPHITGYSNDGKQICSVFTGAWSGKIMEKNNAQTLYELGVFEQMPELLRQNAFEQENRIRLVENWEGAPHAYKKERYKKLMKPPKGQPIVPVGSSPTNWVITFCERTGMRWGNGMFLKKRFRGGKTWNEKEKKIISDIYNIGNIVDRVQKISWNSQIEDHMHFQYWGARSIVYWKDIEKVGK